MSGTVNPGWSKAKYAARGVHLDQDTAGRLLESMGDHARREMIVRVTKVTRQNPAYRPFANDGATSGGTMSEVARFSKPRATKRARTMRRRTGSWHFLIYLSAACTASTVPQPGRPIPSPSLPSPVPVSSAAGPWTFTYAPGSIAYQISRSAGIESQSDSGSRVADTRASWRHNSLQRHRRHVLNHNPGYDRPSTIRTTSCATLGIIHRRQPDNLSRQHCRKMQSRQLSAFS